MTGAPVRTHVEESKAGLADAIVARLVDVVDAAVASRGDCHLVLTGGSMGSAVVEALLRGPGADLPWSRIHLWWGDERFLPAGDPERNDAQVTALVAELSIPEANVHRVATTDGGGTVDDAARAYDDDLRRHAAEGADFPHFDVVMLGMGPDTHVASLFPGHALTRVDDKVTAAEQDSPKPPPQRVTMTFPTLNSADEVWLMVAGADKAEAVRQTRESTDRTAHPASGVHGTTSTTWWLDSVAADGLS